MSRKQSYISSAGFTVLFDGSKTFWKTRTNLDILIAMHSNAMVIEVISYDANAGKETPRFYISVPLLITKIDKDECDRKVAMKKEVFLRQKKDFKQTEVMKEAMNEAMVTFILSRLAIAENTDSADIIVEMVPISTDIIDEETGKMDVICECPGMFTPVVVNYQKKASASEMKKAMHELHAETMRLQQATKMCELVTSSVDGFKLMLAEKMRLEREMKAMYSEARLRWITAINRVLVQNFIAKVHDRLMNSKVRDWYIQMMAKVEEYERRQALEAQQEENTFAESAEYDEFDNSSIGELTSASRVSPARSKMLRRSLDNSQLVRRKSGGGSIMLPQLSPTALAAASGGGAHYNSQSSKNSFAKPILPTLQTSSLRIPGGGSNDSVMERRRRARAGKGQHKTSPTAKQRAKNLRRSFTDGVGVSIPRIISKERSGSIDSTDGQFGFPSALAEAPRTPPTLLKSYSENVPKLLEPVSLTAFGDITRSAKTKRTIMA